MILLLFQVIRKTVLTIDHEKDSLDDFEPKRPDFEYSQIYVPEAKDNGIRHRGTRLNGD